MPEFELAKAKRLSIPTLSAFVGVSGSGKTMSALLYAAGLAGPQGRVAMIDAENKRGSLYADDPLICAALPNGYERVDLIAPYSPKRYIAAVKACEQGGVTVCCIDSTSHEWEGEGGACDIAETQKRGGMPNWALAKKEHKLFLAHCLSSAMHIIFCLRARDKVKIVKDANGKEQIVPIGLQPITERNLVFEVLLSLRFEEDTHFAQPIKVPKMLSMVFPGNRMLTKADGEAVRIWNESGGIGDPMDQVRKRARSAAENGLEFYGEFFKGLTPLQKKALTEHQELKDIAKRADEERAQLEGSGDNRKQEEPSSEPTTAPISTDPKVLNELIDPMAQGIAPGGRVMVKGVLYEANKDANGYTRVIP